MKALKIVLPATLALLLVAALVAPIGPLPGFFIGGTLTNAPEKWEDTSNVHEILLRVPGSIPRVVIVWVVEQDGELHVLGSKDSGWATMIGAESAVEMRIGDDTYALKAVAVAKGWQEVMEAYVAKYRADYPDLVARLPSVDEAEDVVAVFRLDRG